MGSMPLKGSSRRMKLGWMQSARAISTRPPHRRRERITPCSADVAQIELVNQRSVRSRRSRLPSGCAQGRQGCLFDGELAEDGWLLRQ